MTCYSGLVCPNGHDCIEINGEPVACVKCSWHRPNPRRVGFLRHRTICTNCDEAPEDHLPPVPDSLFLNIWHPPNI